MRADETYCERLVRDQDKDRFLATLFAPASCRPALFALYAFDLEIAQVPARVKEPLAGEIRLQWWHDALSGAIPEQAAGNPVAAALMDTAVQFRLPSATLLDVIDAQRLALYPEDDGGSSLTRKAAGIFTLAARILNNGDDPGIDEIVRHAGAAMAIMAKEDMEPTNAAQTQARDHLREMRERLASTPASVWPAFLPLALLRARIDRLESKRQPSADIPQWRRQWILWRASKNLRAWL